MWRSRIAQRASAEVPEVGADGGYKVVNEGVAVALAQVQGHVVSDDCAASMTTGMIRLDQQIAAAV